MGKAINCSAATTDHELADENVLRRGVLSSATFRGVLVATPGEWSPEGYCKFSHGHILASETDPTLAPAPSPKTTEITAEAYGRLPAEIESLREEEDEEDRPTEYAVSKARKLVEGAARELSVDFPNLEFYTAPGPFQSVRINWSHGERELRLVCGGSPQNKTYLYYEISQDRHGIYEPVDEYLLADRLKWLAGLI